MSTSSWVETVSTDRGRRYKVRWRENGRKLSKTFVRKADAEAFRTKKVIPAQAAGRPVEGYGITFGEFMDWVEADFARSQSSRVSMEGLHNQLKLVPDDVRRLPISKVTLDLISELLLQRASQASKQSTVSAYRKALSKVCTNAFTRGYLPLNPMKAVETPAAHGPSRASFDGVGSADPDGPVEKSQIPSTEVAAKMIELLAARHRDYGLVAAVAAGSGLRFGEVIAP